MRIVRAPRQDRYTMLANDTLRDGRLSYRARGILAALLSNRDGWESSAEDLAKHAPEGRDAIRTCLTELERFGYLTRDRVSGRDGKWATVWTVREVPQGAPTTDSQASVSQSSVSQASSEDTSQKTPLPPEGGPVEGQLPLGASCARHPAGAPNCRACGTSRRSTDLRQKADAATERRERERERSRAESAAAKAARVPSDDPTVQQRLAEARAALRGES